MITRPSRLTIILFALFALLPLAESFLPQAFKISDAIRTIFIFTIVGCGLTIVTGSTGMLMLGSGAFMAIGAYSFGIATSPIYPFGLGFIGGGCCALIAGGCAGVLVGLPAVRLRGDYLAIVTLGFGEIIQDLLKNVEVITKGTRGINPVAAPSIGSLLFSSSTPILWYYLLLTLVIVVLFGTHLLLTSSAGRRFFALKSDELAARSIGVPARSTKLLALLYGAGLCSLAGALTTSLVGTTGEPGNYDFNISIIALCIVIVGGLGHVRGILVGATIMIGANAIVLTKLSELFIALELTSTNSVISNPTNWKYLIFGAALVITMRLRPGGIVGGDNS
jgi:branched-chain amino acid transport system permease protein